jgi:Fibrinogen beta and gamma chains, C-terminal globular domain
MFAAIFKPRDCVDIQSNVSTKSGVYTVYIGSTQRPLTVYCDMNTTSGGWTVSETILF